MHRFPAILTLALLCFCTPIHPSTPILVPSNIPPESLGISLGEVSDIDESCKE